MNAYEKIVGAMRDSGRYFNQPIPQIGIVGEDKTVKMDALTLEREDYFLDCNLHFPEDGKYYVHRERISQSGEYLSASDHNIRMEEYTDNVLLAGDRVLVLWIQNDENDTFVVLSKVVA